MEIIVLKPVRGSTGTSDFSITYSSNILTIMLKAGFIFFISQF